MYSPAGSTWKISKRSHAEIREIHRTPPVMLLLLGESDVDGLGQEHAALPTWYGVRTGRAFMSGFGRTVVRMSSSLAAPSAVAILSTALLCGACGTAVSQTATGSATQLPAVTVDAPMQAARPHTPKRVANPVASRRRSPAAETRPASAGAILARPGSIMSKLAALEKISNNCNDGCQTSFKYGNQPWNGCSASGGVPPPFSATCRNVHNYKTYAECQNTVLFLGGNSTGAWWYCSSLLAGGKLVGEKLQVAELKRSGRR